MANLSLPRVNQKLAQAKVLLSTDAATNLTPIHNNSLLEAIAFHLVCAYQHYLREIAETYGLKNTFAIKTESDLVTAFETAKKFPVEAAELVVLRKDAKSWLSHLHSYYDSLWQTPKPSASADGLDTSDSEMLISLVDLDESAIVLTMSFETVNEWQHAFVDLVRRQRQTSAEF